jgi:hypothetical protein
MSKPLKAGPALEDIERPDPWNASNGHIERWEDRRETRACLGCGYSRKVKVTYTTYSKGRVGKRWSRYCQVCDLVIRAKLHESTAREFRARAAELLKKRKST